MSKDRVLPLNSWRDELRRHPLHALVLAGCAIGVVAHQAIRWNWFIDDSAIVFAYARNLAQGLGAVPWPGAERIEAVSDPTWTGLLALGALLGLDGFALAKPIAMIFGVATTVVVWRTAKRGLPDHAGPGALIAPLALALNAQFAIWSASGLENALFCLLVAGAVHRTSIEVERGGFPASAVLYLLIVWTRPEGILYAAVGAGVLLGARGPRALLPWLAIVAVPSALLEAARIAYFAWPLPNTWYAKITARGPAPLSWDRRGWSQIREWSDRLWVGYWTPIYAIGLSGVHGRRALVGLSVVAVLAASLLWPGTSDLRAIALWPALPEPPEWFRVVRILALVLAGAALPLLAIGTPAASVALLSGWTAFVGLFFSVAVDGDWMGAYRFMSLCAPSMAVLLAMGITRTLDALEQRLTAGPSWSPTTWLVGSVAAGLLVPPNFSQTRDHTIWNLNETTDSVRLRVDYTRSILRRTFWEEPVVNIDMDMGAHLWWAPDYRQLDLAMLVDVAMGRHWFQHRAFVREHFFQEHRPTFVNVGGWWAAHSGLRRYPAFEKLFFDLPGYQNIAPLGLFRNVAANRELVMADSWTGDPAHRVGFHGKVALTGWALPAPWVAGEPAYLEAPFELLARRNEKSAVRLLAFLADESGVIASWDLPLGYGIYPWGQWRVDQIFRGRHAVPLPDGIEPGRYDLGFVVMGAANTVLPAEEIPPGATADAPKFARGEVRFPGQVEVVTRAERATRMASVRAELATQAGELSCELAIEAWIRYKRHRPVAWAFHDEERPGVGSEISRCWVGRASADPGSAAEHLARAHQWSPYEPALVAAADPLADRLIAGGHSAVERGDWEAAYQAFAAVLTFAPERAWARRWAEEARDHRLGLTDDVRIGIGGEDDLRAWEERQGKGDH